MKPKLLIASAMLVAAMALNAQPVSVSAPRMLLQGHNMMAPVWSPDGSQIAVTGDNYVGIWVAQADGSQLHQVSNAPGAGYKMSWVDATTLRACPYTLDNNRRITSVENINVATGEATVVGQPMRQHRASRAMDSATPSVLRLMVDDPMNATRQIAELNAYAGRMILNPALSPDGKRIAFQVVGNGTMVCNADGTGVRALGAGAYPSWLPDSRHIMVSRISDDGEVFTASDIYCVNVDNGNATCITAGTDVIPITIAVSPDGSMVAFDNDTDGCIYVIDLKY